jgi:hypothetical protein
MNRKKKRVSFEKFMTSNKAAEKTHVHGNRPNRLGLHVQESEHVMAQSPEEIGILILRAQQQLLAVDELGHDLLDLFLSLPVPAFRGQLIEDHPIERL